MFIKTVGPVTADIMLVGEAPGETEDRKGLPFMGRAGNTLNTLLSQAGIIRSQCLIANVARERPPKNDIKHYFSDKGCKVPTPRMLEYIALLQKEIEQYKPNVVIPLGNTALWTLTGRKGIKHARGSVTTSTLVSGQKILPTYHPQAAGYDWTLATTMVMDLKKALYHSKFPSIPEDKRQLIIDPTKANFIELCQRLLDEKLPVAVDIEAVQAHINRIGFSNSDSWAFTLGTLKGIIPSFPERDELEIWEWIGKVITELPIIYHNAVYDLPVLFLRNGIPTPNLYMDTLVASHILWPELPKSLAYVTSILLDVPAWKHLSETAPGEYNALDALNTLCIAPIMERLLKKRDLWEVFQREMSWIEPASMLQLQGLYVNKEKKESLCSEASERLTKIDQELLEVVGKEVNYNSPAQVKNLLYIDLGLPAQFKRRKNVKEERKVTTGEDALKKLARMHKVPQLIIERRKASKLISTFLDVSTSPESRVHSSYNVTGTGFGGRWSSSKSIILPYGPGNLQNIPKVARSLYTVSKGYVLLEADYIQAEAVVVAYLCLDTVLIKLFNDAFGMSASERAKGYDVHRYTAALMYDIPLEDVTKEQRVVGKTMRHACVDKKTEVLTDTGWKTYLQLNIKVDRVAQWEKGKEISFVYPTQVFEFDYDGELISFESQHIDQLITPNHRIVTKNRKNDNVKTFLSEELFSSRNGDLTIPLSGQGQPATALKLLPDQMRFFMAIQADGSIRTRERHGQEISFKFKKQRKVERLKAILEILDIEYSLYSAKDNYTCFYINGARCQKLFDFILYTNKRLGEWILHLSNEAMNAAVDESKWWDSRRNPSGDSWQYYSVIPENCEWLQIMAHLTGRRAVLSASHPTVYTVSISEYNSMCLSHIKKKRVPYKGKIYSMSVPSSYYIIRRNGKVSVTGNSNYASGPGVLANKLDISMAEAKPLLRLYFQKNHLLPIWHKRIQTQLRRDRTMVNLFGRKHRFLDRWSDSLFRSAYAYNPQSSIGELLNISLRETYDKLGNDIQIYLQLHDAIYSIVHHSETMDVMKELRKIMIKEVPVGREVMKIDVDFKVGDNWKDMEEQDISWR